MTIYQIVYHTAGDDGFEERLVLTFDGAPNLPDVGEDLEVYYDHHGERCDISGRVVRRNFYYEWSVVGTRSRKFATTEIYIEPKDEV